MREHIDEAQREAWANFPRELSRPAEVVMNDVVADTHAIVWYLFDPPRLSAAAAALQAAEASG